MNALNIKQAMALVLAMAVTFVSFAHQPGEKTIEKARNAVENASPDDWHTLAASAEKCLNKEINLKEANEWLDRSIQIKATAYNLSLKGDYYALNKLPKKAVEYYVKAANAAKSNDSKADVTEYQRKIGRITNLIE